MKKSVLLLAVIGFFCFLSILSYSQTPDWLWAKTAAGTSDDYGNAVATDASGNSYLAGSFTSSTLSFGTTDLTNAGGLDIFLVKYDAAGNVIWAKSIGSTGDEEAFSVAVDASGNIYLTGYFGSTTLAFGTYILTNLGIFNVYLTKFDADGNVMWAKSFSSTGEDYGESVAADASGNSYVTGSFYSPTIIIETDTLTNAGNYDIFLAKYDAAGNELWAKGTGGTESDVGRSVVVDATGYIYQAGYFGSTTLAFGTYVLTNKGSTDAFVAKYNSGGNVLWAKSAGGLYYDYGRSVAVDASGNSYLAAYGNSPTIIFGSDTLTNAGSDDIFLAKYDASGDELWAKGIGGTDFDMASSDAVDVSGNVYMTGAFQSPTISFGSNILTNTGGLDIFITEFDPDGNDQWAKSTSGPDDDYASSIAVDIAGDPYLAGNFLSPTLAFDTIILTNPSGGVTYDILAAKLESSITGIKGSNHSFSASVFPNPAKDLITVTTSGMVKESFIEIINLEGRQLIPHQITGPVMQLNISDLPDGIYFFRVTGDNNVSTGKFIKQ